MITDCIQSISLNLKKTDLIIRVIMSSQTSHVKMDDFSDLVRALRLATDHFQISFELSYEFIAPDFSQFIDQCKTQKYCVIVAPKNYSDEVAFLVKSKDWNFIESVDCKLDTYCPHCIPHFWF